MDNSGQQGSGNSQPLILAEPPTGGSSALSEQMQESLRVLSEETLQLSELIWQEAKLTREFCALLKQVLSQLNMSFNLPVNIFSSEGRKLQQVILNPEAHLILINDKNEVESKALEDYSPSVMFNLVSFIIPELAKALALNRQRLNVRIELFDKVNRELRNLRNMSDSRLNGGEDEYNHVEDGIKKSLLKKDKTPDAQSTQ